MLDNYIINWNIYKFGKYKLNLMCFYIFIILLVSCNKSGAKYNNDYKTLNSKNKLYSNIKKSKKKINTGFYLNPLKAISALFLLFVPTVESKSYIRQNNFEDSDFDLGNKIIQTSDLTTYIGGSTILGDNIKDSLFLNIQNETTKVNTIIEDSDSYISDMLLIEEGEGKDNEDSLLLLSNIDEVKDQCRNDDSKKMTISSYGLKSKRFLWSTEIGNVNGCSGKVSLKNKLKPNEILIGGDYITLDNIKKSLIYTYDISENGGYIPENSFILGNGTDSKLDSMFSFNNSLFSGGTIDLNNKTGSYINIIDDNFENRDTYLISLPENNNNNLIVKSENNNLIGCININNLLTKKEEVILYNFDFIKEKENWIVHIEIEGDSSCENLKFDENILYLSGGFANNINMTKKPSIMTFDINNGKFIEGVSIKNDVGYGQINSFEIIDLHDILFTGFISKYNNKSSLLDGKISFKDSWAQYDDVTTPINIRTKNITDFNFSKINLELRKGPPLSEGIHKIKIGKLIPEFKTIEYFSDSTLDPTFEPTLNPAINNKESDKYKNDYNNNLSYLYYSICLGFVCPCIICLLICLYIRRRKKLITSKYYENTEQSNENIYGNSNINQNENKSMLDYNDDQFQRDNDNENIQEEDSLSSVRIHEEENNNNLNIKIPPPPQRKNRLEEQKNDDMPIFDDPNQIIIKIDNKQNNNEQNIGDNITPVFAAIENDMNLDRKRYLI